MAGIYFYKYNNYYNRRFKREETLDAYGTPVYYETQNLNFNPADGVNTVYIAGRQNNPYLGACNYVIYSADNIAVTSRWFIIEQTRNLQGQYTVQLRRDVVADYYNFIITAPAFIEKAILKDTDPFIYNDEQMTVNQIKTYTKDIKDRSNCAWIVGYLNRKYAGGEVEISGVTVPDITVDSLSNWEYYKYTTTPVKAVRNCSINFLIYASLLREGTISTFDWYVADVVLPMNAELTSPTEWSWQDLSDANGSNGSPYLNAPFNSFSDKYDHFVNYLNQNFDKSKWNYKQYLSTPSSYNQQDYNTISSLVGQVIYDKNANKYYKISTNEVQSQPYQTEIVHSTVTGQELDRVVNAYPHYYSNDSSLIYKQAYNASEITVVLTEVTVANLKVTLPASEARYHLKDAPYDMFCIPYADNYEITDDIAAPTFTVTHNKQNSMSIAQGLAQAVGTQEATAAIGSNLYDLQLLPFCPFTGYTMINDHKMSLNCKGNTLRYTLLKKNDNDAQAIMIWSTASSGNMVVDPGIKYTENKKIGNQCDMMRIVSPNYNGIYEFNPAKNGGLKNLNISFTYLPYQPFIRIKPQFGGIYAPKNGEQFDDATGLICQGDFSLSYLSDKWAEYQVQNKNYNNIFDREIENLELQHKLQRELEPWQLRAGNISGAASGAMSGGVVGGLAGGIVGGLIGGAASIAAGLKDREVNETLRQEALDYKNDMFGFQLGNIKALPNSITKVTAYNIINNVFPLIEFYTCTPEEKLAVAKKIAWNSMTVGRIGVIDNFLNNSWRYEYRPGSYLTDEGYIKAKLIRINYANDDFHLFNTISDELNKGVYFK